MLLMSTCGPWFTGLSDDDKIITTWIMIITFKIQIIGLGIYEKVVQT